MIPRDTYRSIPQPASLDQVPLDRWKELNADARAGRQRRQDAQGRPGQHAADQRRQRRVGDGAGIQRQRHQHPGQRRCAPTRTPSPTKCTRSSARCDGIARTKIAFSSDRDGERIRGPVGDRGISNIYMSDYDGARQQRVTISKSLDISPVWSPDGRSIAFSSWRTNFQDIYVLFPYGGPELQNPTKGTSGQAELPARLVARRHEARVHLEPRRQRRDLRDEPRRQRRAAADQPSDDRRHADVVADGNAAGVHLGPHRHAADLHRQRRRHAAAADHPRVVLRPADLVAGAAQRDRLLRASRRRQHHQGLRLRDTQHPRADRQHRQQREPGLLAERPPHRLRVEPRRQGADLHASTATARDCGRSPGRERTAIRTGRNSGPTNAKERFI